MKKAPIFFMAILLVTQGKTQNHLTVANTTNFIKGKVDCAFNKNEVASIFAGVINNGNPIYYSAGFANPDKKSAFDSTTLFEIGSITKTFTAYALQKVLDENKIADTASILPYLPDSVQLNKALEKITFLNLMNHTAGLRRLPDNMNLFMDDKAPYDHYTSSNLFGFLKHYSPVMNGKSNYSNLGMGLAGVLAEWISKKSYAVLLEKNIFRPFKIIEGVAPFSMDDNKSQGYFDDEKVPYWNRDVLAPAGGLKCTGKVMMTYLQYMAIPKSPAAKKIIAEILQPTVSINVRVKVCKAWHTLEEKDQPIIYWHNGGTYGFSTFAAFIKGEQKAVIVVINKFNQNSTSDALGIAIMKELSR